MAYYVETTDRENLPAGKDWIFLQHPSGDCRFVMANDASFVMPPVALASVVEQLAEAECLDIDAIAS